MAIAITANAQEHYVKLRAALSAVHPKLKQWIDNGDLTKIETCYDMLRMATGVYLTFGNKVWVKFYVDDFVSESSREYLWELTVFLMKVFDETAISKIALVLSAAKGNQNGEKTFSVEL